MKKMLIGLVGVTVLAAAVFAQPGTLKVHTRPKLPTRQAALALAQGCEAIDRLASDPALARRLGEAGRERVRDLAWEPVVRRLLGA